MRIPKSLTKCPIYEALCEIRFDSSLPVDMVWGGVYYALKANAKYSLSDPIRLNIANLPPEVREQDENLKYSSFYEIEVNHLRVGIGPQVLIFYSPIPYKGWNDWSNIFIDIFNIINDSKNRIIATISRIGLRYINFFPDEYIMPHLNANINLCNHKYDDKELIHLRLESPRGSIQSGEGVTILQIGNRVMFHNKNIGGPYPGAIIDIDCISFNLGKITSIKNIVDQAHEDINTLFYDLLNSDYINTLGPIYDVSTNS